jgi:hypothetical protein
MGCQVVRTHTHHAHTYAHTRTHTTHTFLLPHLRTHVRTQPCLIHHHHHYPTLSLFLISASLFNTNFFTIIFTLLPCLYRLHHSNFTPFCFNTSLSLTFCLTVRITLTSQLSSLVSRVSVSTCSHHPQYPTFRLFIPSHHKSYSICTPTSTSTPTLTPTPTLNRLMMRVVTRRCNRGHEGRRQE